MIRRGKVNLYRRHQQAIETAKISGVNVGVQQQVELIEAPPPIKWPGYADAIRSPPAAKAEAPKAVPDVPKAVAKPAEKTASEQPAQKKAALTSEPKPVPAASSAAKFLEPAPKVPLAKAGPKEPAGPPHGATTSKTALESKALVKKARPKGVDQVHRPEQVKIEVCGLMLDDAVKIDRTKIAERRKEALHKLGRYYGFTGEHLQEITRDQLDSLGLLGDQARGSSSPESDLIKVAKSRHDRAVGLGYKPVLDRKPPK